MYCYFSVVEDVLYILVTTEKGSHLQFNRKVKGLKAAHVQAVRREPTGTQLFSPSAKLSFAPLLGSGLLYSLLLQIDHILVSGLIKPLYAIIEPCLAYFCLALNIFFYFIMCKSQYLFFLAVISPPFSVHLFL